MSSDAELDHAWSKRENTICRAEISALYHQKRERFFELFDKLGKAAAVVGGSAALWKLSDTDAVARIAALITVTSALSLVFSFSERSKKHAELARSYRDLIAEIVNAGDFDITDAAASGWLGKLCALEAKEPPTLSALTVMCQNEIAIARQSKVYPQRFYIRWFAHFLDLPQTHEPAKNVPAGVTS